MGTVVAVVLIVGLVSLSIYLGYSLYKEIARLRRKKRIDKEINKNKE